MQKLSYCISTELFSNLEQPFFCYVNVNLCHCVTTRESFFPFSVQETDNQLLAVCEGLILKALHCLYCPVKLAILLQVCTTSWQFCFLNEETVTIV